MLHRTTTLLQRNKLRALALAAALAGLACGRTGTSLLVTATFDPALKIDQLLVVGQRSLGAQELVLEPGTFPPMPGGLLAPGASVAILLKDDVTMGGPFTLIVDGRARGVRVASAHAQVYVEPGHTNPLPVTLGKITCDPSACQIGERRCEGSGWRICLSDELGCGAWSDIALCSNMGRCMAGACLGTCLLGQHLCDGACVSESEPAHCGASCKPCPTAPHARAACDGTSCLLTCETGYKMCQGACVPPTDARCKS